MITRLGGIAHKTPGWGPHIQVASLEPSLGSSENGVLGLQPVAYNTEAEGSKRKQREKTA